MVTAQLPRDRQPLRRRQRRNPQRAPGSGTDFGRTAASQVHFNAEGIAWSGKTGGYLIRTAGIIDSLEKVKAMKDGSKAPHRDPVCGMKVDERKAAEGASTGARHIIFAGLRVGNSRLIRNVIYRGTVPPSLRLWEKRILGLWNTPVRCIET